MRSSFLALVSAASCLAGCSPNQQPFRMVQLCLTSPREIPEFTSFMNMIAHDNRLKLTDRSRDAEAEMRAMTSVKLRVPRPLVLISANGSGEARFSATNLGLPAEQIAVTFGGNDRKIARPFADAVVAKLSHRWRVHEGSVDRGALPLSDCE